MVKTLHESNPYLFIFLFVTILFFVRLACILHSPSLNDRSVAANMEYIGSQETYMRRDECFY